MAAPQAMRAVQIAKILSIPAAGFLSGMICCMSFAGIPAVAVAPPDIASKQWKRIYDIGVSAMPPMVVSVAACFAFLAAKSNQLPGLYPSATFDLTQPRVLYAAAAVTLPSIVPYTIAVMKPTNEIIMARATSTAKSTSTDAEIPFLLQRWAQLNYVRAAIVGSGALLAATVAIITPL